MVISGNVSGRDLGGLVQEIQRKVQEKKVKHSQKKNLRRRPRSED
jgi:Cu/Ag efflux pump CusA